MEKSQRVDHDVDNALRTLKIAVAQVEEGYRFDDALAVEKVKRLKDAIATLEDFVKKLRS